MLIQTSTSPSVYVIYSTLRGVYDCDEYYSQPNLGFTHDEVTIGYPPEALSTGVCYHTNWRAINYTELYYPPPDYVVVTQAACSMDIGDPRTVDSSHILAGSPIFSLPGDITQIDPLWSTCIPAPPGGYDPPRVLNKADNLVPALTTPAVTQAKPEPSATLQLPAETGPPRTPNGANIGQGPQDPKSSGTNSQDTSTPGGIDPQESSDPGGTSPQDPSNPGAKSPKDPSTPGGTNPQDKSNSGGTGPQALDPSSSPSSPSPSNQSPTTGKQSGSSGSQQAPGAKGNEPNFQDSDNPSDSSAGDEGSTGASPQVNGGNVASGPAEVSNVDSPDSKDPDIATSAGSAGKVNPGFVSPESDNSKGSDNSVPLQEAPGGGLKLGTVTIPPGATTTHSGHTFSVGSKFVLVDGTSFDLQSKNPSVTPGPAHSGGPSQHDGYGGGVVIGTTRLPSGTQTTYSGHIVSAGSNIVVVDDISYAIRSSGSSLVIGSSTLPLGVQTTYSGHIVSAGPGLFVLDGISYVLSPSSAILHGIPGDGIIVGSLTLPGGAQTTNPEHTLSVGSSVFAVDGTIYTEASGGGLIMGTITLPPGAQVTESSHVISVGSGSAVIDGISYTWVASALSLTSASQSGNLGGLIMSAFGTGAPANSTASPLAFMGDAARLRTALTPGLTVMMTMTYIVYNYIL